MSRRASWAWLPIIEILEIFQAELQKLAEYVTIASA